MESDTWQCFRKSVESKCTSVKWTFKLRQHRSDNTLLGLPASVMVTSQRLWIYGFVTLPGWSCNTSWRSIIYFKAIERCRVAFSKKQTSPPRLRLPAATQTRLHRAGSTTCSSSQRTARWRLQPLSPSYVVFIHCLIPLLFYIALQAC